MSDIIRMMSSKDNLDKDMALLITHMMTKIAVIRAVNGHIYTGGYGTQSSYSRTVN